MKQLETYLEALFSSFVPTSEVEETKREYTVHLLESVTKKTSMGISLDEAIEASIVEFGHPYELARDIESSYSFTKISSSMPSFPSVLLATGISILDEEIKKRLPHVFFRLCSPSTSIIDELSSHTYSTLLISELITDTHEALNRLLLAIRHQNPNLHILFIKKDDKEDVTPILNQCGILDISPQRFTVQDLEISLQRMFAQ